MIVNCPAVEPSRGLIRSWGSRAVPASNGPWGARPGARVPGPPAEGSGDDGGGSPARALAGARPDGVGRLVVANAPYRSVNLLRAIHLPLFALPAVPELVFRLGGAQVVDLMFSIGWKARGVTLDAAAPGECIAAYARQEHVADMPG